ncbi:MAG TPA: hypothetical protein VFV54_01680 [Thermoanaerobaculia bacterium]|nr:hypothetical protein [Thermoanaerobaculia bacterium]
MRKILAISLLGALAATAALADYTVVLKDGRRLQARQKWTMSGGKAIVELTNGTRLQLDPAMIDAAQSEAATRSGLGDAKVLEMAPQTAAPARKQQPSLGSIANIRKQPDAAPAKPAPAPAPASTRKSSAPSEPATVAGAVDGSVAEKFNAAYENVGLFERKLSLSEEGRLRIDLMADTEDQVFKAISATAFVFANVPSNYTGIDLFLRTVNGGSAGRFQMSREDAQAVATKKLEWYDYYVRNVIF